MKNRDYITVDGRQDHESFRDCVTQIITDLEENQGIHVIMDFEPTPLYKYMKGKGFDKRVEKVSDEEYHVYFDKGLENIQMGQHLDFDEAKIRKIVQIKYNFLTETITYDQARDLMLKSFDSVTSQEFAICEQYLENKGISPEEIYEKMDQLVSLFDGLLVHDKPDLEEGHPVGTYLNEVKAIRDLLSKMTSQVDNKFIKNVWLEIYEDLSQINTHFARKQNQLYPLLERKGFDRPSKVMWTLENDIRDLIKEAGELLKNDQDQAFLDLQKEVIEMVEDMMVKEEEILYPTALDLISHEEFVHMRISDDEIGYCLIDKPKSFGKVENDLMKDLANLLSKHGLTTQSGELDVSMGKLTLEQINLIFKHLQVDLSYVDENEIVKFYSDTKHRVFPRSAGVIGREVQNCHPRESVETVEEIIRAFKTGEQDQAEFWLEINGKFIYIIYNAVRDDQGQFRGVLEMMQDVTHIRALEGSQRLLSWQNDNKAATDIKDIESAGNNDYGIDGQTLIGSLVKNYPFLKDFLVGLSPKFKKLKNPVLFKTMSSVATIDMIAGRGGFDTKLLIEQLVEQIDAHL